MMIDREKRQRKKERQVSHRSRPGDSFVLIEMTKVVKPVH